MGHGGARAASLSAQDRNRGSAALLRLHVAQGEAAQQAPVRTVRRLSLNLCEDARMRGEDGGVVEVVRHGEQYRCTRPSLLHCAARVCEGRKIYSTASAPAHFVCDGRRPRRSSSVPVPVVHLHIRRPRPRLRRSYAPAPPHIVCGVHLPQTSSSVLARRCGVRPCHARTDPGAHAARETIPGSPV